MAGGNKKKKAKPAANPARGFATTSIATKVARVEDTDESSTSITPKVAAVPSSTTTTKATSTVPAEATPGPTATPKKEELSPEEFERQLEESELQLLVEKLAVKVKRDAQRQRSRLETDRRLLRGQAEAINTRKWLPQELMDQILDLIKAEYRFAASSMTTESASPAKLLPEEDLMTKIWTLQQTLVAAAFPEERVESVLRHVLDIAPYIGAVPKDSIWGLDEAFDWLARECTKEELPGYEQRQKTGGRLGDTPQDSPLPSGATTPQLLEAQSGGSGSRKGSSKYRPSREPSPKKLVVTCDSDIEPDDLISVYLDTKTKLFHMQRPRQGDRKTKSSKKGLSGASSSANGGDPLSPEDELKEAKLLAKIDRIEQDPLFDKPLANHQWQSDRIVLEQEYAEMKRQKAEQENHGNGDVTPPMDEDSEDEVAKEARKMAEEVLQEENADEDASLSDLFASLPMEETDPSTGKTANVVTSANGAKVYIRDFGSKWAGISPMRALEETSRSR